MPLALPENRNWYEIECGYCKAGFCTFLSNQLYCSYFCKDKAKYKYEKKPEVEKQCGRCHKKYKDRTSITKYCPPCRSKAKPTGRPRGQPTMYKKKYCEALIKHMKQGLSYETFGATIGVSKATVYNWESNVEFLEAKRLAWGEYQLFWEKIGLHGTSGKLKGFNSTSFIYNMKCRFRNTDTWSANKDEEQQTFNFNLNYDPKDLKDDG